MSLISARSPFIITIDEVGQTNTQVELRFKRLADPSFPVNADYTLTKNIPAVNITETNYNISPYIREYITFTYPWVYDNSYNTAGPNATQLIAVYEANYILLEVKRYYNSTLIDTTIYIGVDGWGFYEEGTNPNFEVGGVGDEGNILLSEGTYYYLSDCSDPNGKPDTDIYSRFPTLVVKCGVSWDVKITNLDTLGTSTTSLNAYTNKMVFISYVPDYTNRYKIEILDVGNVVVWTGYFYPQNESKYTSLCCDFINKFGAWQRTWFYKASRQNMEVTQEEYKGLDGIFKPFNTNGKESVTVNTGWVDEEYNDIVLKQLMFSEKILLDGQPVKLKSKSVELKKHINDRTINYTIEFDYSYDMLNTISL